MGTVLRKTGWGKIAVVVLAVACSALTFLYPEWQKLAQAQGYCSLPPGRAAVFEVLSGNERCFAFTENAFLGTKLEDQRGNKLELYCRKGEFALDYVTAQGGRTQVGRCPWAGGINGNEIEHTGDIDGDGKIDCILQTFWRSQQPSLLRFFGGNPLKVDWKEYRFSPSQNPPTLILKHYAAFDGPGSYGADRSQDLIKEAMDVDILTFNPDPDLSNNPPPMRMRTYIRCDIDDDRDCDSDDIEHFNGSFGSCLGDVNYSTLADGDHDTCVTTVDRQRVLAGVVIIDVKPSINPKSRGVIPVAILSTDTFDATTVDPMSVVFGPAEAKEKHGKGHIEDVDGDGGMDLVLHFKTQDTGITCLDDTVQLKGQTIAGEVIEGWDSINTVGCKK